MAWDREEDIKGADERGKTGEERICFALRCGLAPWRVIIVRVDSSKMRPTEPAAHLVFLLLFRNLQIVYRLRPSTPFRLLS